MVIPARDEQDTIRECLRSVRIALQQLPPDIVTAVTVVLDGCRDRTAEKVAAIAAGWPELTAVTVARVRGRGAGHGGVPVHSSDAVHIVRGSGVGPVRALGVRVALDRLSAVSGAVAPSSTWLLSTDADTVVPRDWAAGHVQLAQRGIVAIAGMADLDRPGALTPEAQIDYRMLMEGRTDGLCHENVYGANLGVRADAYLAVGGFPEDVVGEDHLLWTRLVEAGYPVKQTTALRVRTSARIHGRAAGGLADLLHTLCTSTALADGTAV